MILLRVDARVGGWDYYEAPTEFCLFPKDPPDEHAIMSALEGAKAYGGRAILSEWPEKIPRLTVVSRQPRKATCDWWCLCGSRFHLNLYQEPFEIIGRICEQFDNHVGRI